MFAGHMAVALGAKAATPRIPLWILVAAAFGLDLLWPLLLLAGVEQVRIAPGITAFTPLDFTHYPWSHSLAMTVLWAVLAGMLTRRAVRVRSAAVIAAALVISHWVLDFVTHRPDLPLWPGGRRVGLGLWQSIPGTIAIEGALFVAAVVLFLRGTPPRDAVGRWAFGGMVTLVLVAWISSPFSPPPPNTTAIAVVGLALWLFVPWAAWIDRRARRIV